MLSKLLDNIKSNSLNILRKVNKNIIEKKFQEFIRYMIL